MNKFKGQKGMTLIEVVITLVIGSMFLSMLLGFVTVSSGIVKRTVATREVEANYQRLRQFILEEINEATTVCMQVYTNNPTNLDQTIYMCHEGHGNVNYNLYKGLEKQLYDIKLDFKKINHVGKNIERIIDMRRPMNSDKQEITVMFQNNKLSSGFEEVGVSGVKGINLLTDGNQSYIKILLEDTVGNIYEGQFGIPLEDKGELDVSL
ncbi:MAG: type II secretion system protein [Cellulosilyticaceae bacterium]